MKLLKLLIFINLLFFVTGEMFRFNIANDIFLKPLDASVLLTFFVWIFLLILNKIKQPNIKWQYLFFPTTILISIVVNSYWLMPIEIFTATLYALRFVSFFSLFFIVASFDKDFKQKLLNILFILGIVILIISYLQYFLYSSLRNVFYLGFDEHYFRIFSVFLDPNFAGVFFVLFFLFIFTKLVIALKKEKLKQKIFLFILFLISITTVFLTFSRTALLSLIISFSIYLVFLKKKKFILHLISALAMFILITYPFYQIESLNLFRTTSGIGRIESYTTSLKVASVNPIFGTGFGAYRYARKFHEKEIIDENDFPENSKSGVENSFLYVFATTGLVGLGAFFILWKQILNSAFKTLKKNNDQYQILVISSIACFFVSALFINSLFFPALMLWIFIILAILL